MRVFFTYILLWVLASISLISKDYWYKTDFPDSQHVQQFYTESNNLYILTDNGGLYQFGNSLNFIKIADPIDSIRFNSVALMYFNGSGDKFYAGTESNGIMVLENGEWHNFNTEFDTCYVDLISEGYYKYVLKDGQILYKFDSLYDNQAIKSFSSPVIKFKINPMGGSYDILTKDTLFSINGYFNKVEVVNSLMPGNDAIDFTRLYIDRTVIITKNHIYNFYGYSQNIDSNSCFNNTSTCITGFNDGIPTTLNDTTVHHMGYSTLFIGSDTSGVFENETCEYMNDGLIGREVYNLLLTGISNNLYVCLFAATKNHGVFVVFSVMHFGDVNSENSGNNFEMNPNPVTSNISIQSECSISSIQVYDIFGNMVLESNGNHSAELNLDLSSLPVGTYYCKAVIGRKIVVKKIMKI